MNKHDSAGLTPRDQHAALLNFVMRCNKPATLATIPTRNDLAPKKIRSQLGPYLERVKDANEARSPTDSFHERPVWVPHSMEPVRTGASDHLQYKSRGHG